MPVFKRNPPLRGAGGPCPLRFWKNRPLPTWMRRKSANLIEIPENQPLLPLAEKPFQTTYCGSADHVDALSSLNNRGDNNIKIIWMENFDYGSCSMSKKTGAKTSAKFNKTSSDPELTSAKSTQRRHRQREKEKSDHSRRKSGTKATGRTSASRILQVKYKSVF